MKASDLEVGQEYAYSDRNGWADASRWSGQNPPSRIRLATLGDSRNGRVFCELVAAGGGGTLWIGGQTIGPGGRGWFPTRHIRGPWAECLARWQESKAAVDAADQERDALARRAADALARLRALGLDVTPQSGEGAVSLPLVTVEALAEEVRAARYPDGLARVPPRPDPERR